MNAHRFPTQVAPPRGPRHLIRRPRLTEALHGALDRRAVVVAAPAGYGKTSLLIELDRAAGRPCGWLTLDEWLRDPIELIGALAAAVERAIPGTAACVEHALKSSAGEDTRVRLALVALVERLATIPRGVVVLDDVHHLDEAGRALELLAELLDNAPVGWCLVLAGRWLPGLACLPRLALDGEVMEFSTEQLALTAGETRSLAQALGRNTLGAASAERLREETGGWAAAVVLRCQALAATADDCRVPALVGAPQPAAAAAPLSVDLFEYLARTVLDELTVSERNLLVRIAIARVVDDATYALLAGTEPSGPLPVAGAAPPVLAQLARRHAFIGASGASGASDATDAGALNGACKPPEPHAVQYRLHDLFRDFLLAEGRSAAPAFVARLHEAVGRLYQAAGNPAEACYHYRAAESWPNLVAASLTIVERLRAEGRWRALVTLVDELPEQALALDPELPICRAEACCNLSRPEEALEGLAALWPRLEGAESRTCAEALAVRGIALRWCGSHADAIVDSRAAEQILVRAGVDGPRLARVRRLLGIAIASSGDSAGALPILEQAVRAFEAGGELREQSLAHDSLAAALLQLGRAARAATHLERARHGWSSLGNGHALTLTLNNLGVAHTLLGDLDRAEDVLLEAQREADASDNTRATVSALLGRADVLRERDDGPGMLPLATEALQRARAAGEPYLAGHALQLLADSHRLVGALDRAEALGREAVALAAEQAGRFEQGTAALGLGLVLTDQADLASAIPMLRDAVTTLVECDAGRELVRARIALATALSRTGQHDEADDTLVAAVRTARALELHPLLRRYARRQPALFAATATRHPGSALFQGLLARDGAETAAQPSTDPVTAAAGNATLSTASPTQPAPRVTVRILGDARVLVDGVDVPMERWGSDKARELLIFLMTRARPTPAHDLIEALWPDAEATAARHTLHTTVYRLRLALYRDCVESSRDGYRLNRGGVFWLDTHEFARLADGPAGVAPEERWQRLEAAAALYAGPVVTSAFGQWAEDLRAECEVRYLRVLNELAAAYLERRQFARALATAEQGLALDPWCEPMVRVAFDAHLAAGDMVAATRTFRRYRDRAAAAGLRPSRELLERHRLASIRARMPLTAGLL